MLCLKGPWRLDFGLMVLYQMTLFFSVQMLFVIFLEFMPKTYCTDDGYCYKMKSKCLTDFERKSDSAICPANMTGFPKISWLGRRLLFIVSQLIANAAYISILAALWSHNKETWWYTISYTIAFSAQSLCLETCYLSLAELMPTDVRTTAGAITNILMKIGSILASTTKPIKFWYEPMLFMINLVVCTCGLVVVWKYLPESKNVNIQLVGQDDVSDDEEDVEKSEKSSEDEEKSEQSEDPSSSEKQISNKSQQGDDSEKSN